ncbi:hypothetical protein RBA41_28005 [Massilia sp. CCM 9210]|uniref:hypothetical protein n=1 Tax=Massilia scottii TaxID=3057166 RepID=UPI002796A9F5|nr:hypothetical protein [Massilia sp. CCM 9210]MDQ1817157.1 hypothetical protein [Massilia sp. CCM 9210]
MIDHYEAVRLPFKPALPYHTLSDSVRAALWFGGVILPLISLALVHVGYVGGSMPLPGTMLIHVFLIISVPLANALLLRAMMSERPSPPRPLALLHGFAATVSTIYTIVFLPLIPITTAVILSYGIFLLLVLAPLLSLIALLAGRRLLGEMVRETGGAPLPSAWPGVLVAMAVVAAVELPAAVTLIGMRMATSSVHATRADGVRLLRHLGNEKMIASMCKRQDTSVTDLSGLMLTIANPIKRTQACPVS